MNQLETYRSKINHEFTKLQNLLESIQPCIPNATHQMLIEGLQSLIENHNQYTRLVVSGERNRSNDKKCEDGDQTNNDKVSPESRLPKYPQELSFKINDSFSITTELMFLEGREVYSLLQTSQSLYSSTINCSFFRVFPYSVHKTFNDIVNTFYSVHKPTHCWQVWSEFREKFSRLGSRYILPSLKSVGAIDFLRDEAFEHFKFLNSNDQAAVEFLIDRVSYFSIDPNVHVLKRRSQLADSLHYACEFVLEKQHFSFFISFGKKKNQPADDSVEVDILGLYTEHTEIWRFVAVHTCNQLNNLALESALHAVCPTNQMSPTSFLLLLVMAGMPYKCEIVPMIMMSHPYDAMKIDKVWVEQHLGALRLKVADLLKQTLQRV